MILDASENPVIAYQAGNLDLRVLHCGSLDCSGGNVIATPDTAGNVGYGPSIVLDGSGNPVVSYGSPLRVLHCGNPNCTSGNTIAAPEPSVLIVFQTSLQLDATGRPVVSYFDGTNGLNKVLFCGDVTCTSGNPITPVDVHGSLRLDGSGNPVIAGRSITLPPKHALKILHCGDATCSSGNSTAVVDSSISVQRVDLALDGSGIPIIAYSTGLAFRIVHCNDVNCAGDDETIVAPLGPGGGAIGQDWLALDSSGNPVVSVQSAAGGDLTVLQCGNPDCTSSNSASTLQPGTRGFSELDRPRRVRRASSRL